MSTRSWRLICALALVAARSPLSRAQAVSLFAINMLDARPLVVTRGARRAMDIDDLEYDEDKPLRGARLILHGRQVTYLVVAAPTLCGNAGCPVVLVDSASHRRIGQFIARRVQVLAQRVDGWPVLELDAQKRLVMHTGRYSQAP